MVTNEIARVTVKYSMLGASEPQNVFYMQLASGSISDADALADIDNWVLAGWAGHWDDYASEDASCLGHDTVIMNLDGTVKRVLGGDTFVQDGLGVGDVLPAANSGLLVAPTALPKSRGRKFVPGLGNGAITDGLLESDVLAYLVTLGTYFVNTYINGSNSYTMGILSTVLEQFVPFLLTATTTDVMAYQRRRKPGVGI